MGSSSPLPYAVRLGLLGVALFLAGGLISFAYSYRPLHGAKTWKIEELEARLDERNRENMELGDELARLQSRETSRIEPETLAQVEEELSKTRKALTQAEKDLERANRKRKESNSSASRWRSRYEKLRDESAAAAAAAPAAPTPAPGPAETAPALDSAAPDPSVNFIDPVRPIPPEASPAAAENGMLPAEPPASAPNP